jgi:hypothetical protein
MAMDVRAYNREAWDKLVESGDRWTVPVTTDEIQRAKQGEWQIVLTPTMPVPKSWFPDLHGASTLCLASGGGQQGPILAAAGAKVTVLPFVSFLTMSACKMAAWRFAIRSPTLI